MRNSLVIFSQTFLNIERKQQKRLKLNKIRSHILKYYVVLLCFPPLKQKQIWRECHTKYLLKYFCGCMDMDVHTWWRNKLLESRWHTSSCNVRLDFLYASYNAWKFDTIGVKVDICFEALQCSFIHVTLPVIFDYAFHMPQYQNKMINVSTDNKKILSASLPYSETYNKIYSHRFY